MTDYLPWVVDGVCLLILVFGFREGWKKGFASMFLRFFSWLIAAIATYFLYKYVAAFLDKCGITAAIAARLKEAIMGSRNEAVSSVSSLLQTIKVPQFLETALKLHDTPDVYGLMGVSESIEYTTQYIAQTVVNAMSILVLFIVLVILIRWLAKRMKFVNKIPIVGKANALVGGLLNLVVSIMFVSFLLLTVTTVGSGREAFAPLIEAIDRSMVMSLLQKVSLLNTWMVNIF